MSCHDLDNPPAPWAEVIWARSLASLSIAAVKAQRNGGRPPQHALNEDHCATKWLLEDDGTASPIRYSIPWRPVGRSVR